MSKYNKQFILYLHEIANLLLYLTLQKIIRRKDFRNLKCYRIGYTTYLLLKMAPFIKLKQRSLTERCSQEVITYLWRSQLFLPPSFRFLSLTKSLLCERKPAISSLPRINENVIPEKNSYAYVLPSVAEKIIMRSDLKTSKISAIFFQYRAFIYHWL